MTKKEEQIDKKIESAIERIEKIKSEIRELEAEKVCINMSGAEKELYMLGYDKKKSTEDVEIFDCNRKRVGEDAVQKNMLVNRIVINQGHEYNIASVGISDDFFRDSNYETVVGISTIVAIYHLLKERRLVK